MRTAPAYNHPQVNLTRVPGHQRPIQAIRRKTPKCSRNRPVTPASDIGLTSALLSEAIGWCAVSAPPGPQALLILFADTAGRLRPGLDAAARWRVARAARDLVPPQAAGFTLLQRLQTAQAALLATRFHLSPGAGKTAAPHAAGTGLGETPGHPTVPAP